MTASLALYVTAVGWHTVFAQVLGPQNLHHLFKDDSAQLHLQLHLQLPIHLLLLAENFSMAVAQTGWM